MGYSVFVSYKYNDSHVRDIGPKHTVRDYVDVLREQFKKMGYVWKGETSDKDMSGYSDKYIEEELKKGIFPSSVTVVLISPEMKDLSMNERSQWIPWEIEYSLKDIEHGERTSHSNAIVAVILPDAFGFDTYSDVMWCFGKHFKIVEENIDNGYIETVKWPEFRSDPGKYIERAIQKSKRIKPAKASWRT